MPLMQLTNDEAEVIRLVRLSPTERAAEDAIKISAAREAAAEKARPGEIAAMEKLDSMSSSQLEAYRVVLQYISIKRYAGDIKSDIVILDADKGAPVKVPAELLTAVL